MVGEPSGNVIPTLSNAALAALSGLLLAAMAWHIRRR
jgi:hypothetical protein